MSEYWANRWAMGDVLKQFVKTHRSQKAAAKALLVSEQYLCDILKRRRDISDAVANKLGYDRIVVFVRQKENKS